MGNFVVVWIDSYGAALAIANELSHKGLQLLECAMIGQWGQVILRDESASFNLEDILQKYSKNQKVLSKVIKNIDANVENAYLSLASVPVGDFLLSLELEFLGDALELAQRFSKEGLKIVDLRLLRFQVPKCILLLTGSTLDKEKLVLAVQNIQSQNSFKMNLNWIENISKPIKNLFSFEP